LLTDIEFGAIYSMASCRAGSTHGGLAPIAGNRLTTTYFFSILKTSPEFRISVVFKVVTLNKQTPEITQALVFAHVIPFTGRDFLPDLIC
jgi:hypothetical protein